MICQSCGIEAPTKYVEFYQNIGAILVRFNKSIKGNLCKTCINEHFWPLTGTTLILGWWGIISLFLTPLFLLNNIVRYLGTLTLDAPAPGATKPRLTEDAIQKIQPFSGEIFERLNNGEKLEKVAENIAERIAVTQGQVALYIIAVVRATKKQK